MLSLSRNSDQEEAMSLDTAEHRASCICWLGSFLLCIAVYIHLSRSDGVGTAINALKKVQVADMGRGRQTSRRPTRPFDARLLRTR